MIDVSKLLVLSSAVQNAYKQKLMPVERQRYGKDIYTIASRSLIPGGVVNVKW